MTIQGLQNIFLRSGSCRIAPEDFFVLLAYATGKDKTFLLAHPEYLLDRETETRAREYFARRLKHEPVAYITRHKEFYGRDFIVTKDTLIPRPETEHIIERVLDEISNFKFQISKKIVIIDVGTGSGNIIITLAKEIQKVHETSRTTYHATDISEEALNIARENAKRHDVTSTIEFHAGNLLEPIDKNVFETADDIIIAANLPYLSEEVYLAADDDVKCFEPHDALVSAEAGLDHYYRLLEQTSSIQTPTILFLEISPEQTPLIQTYLSKNFPTTRVSIHQDLSGRDRVVKIRM